MSFITLKHAQSHSALGSDPLAWSSLFTGMSAADLAALRSALGVSVGADHLFLMTVVR